MARFKQETIETFRNKNGHEIDGLWLPRVTSITGIISKPALFRYYAQHQNFMTAQEALNQSANWGTTTHQAVEKIFKEDKEDGIDPKILPSIRAFREWQKKAKIKVLDVDEDIEREIFDLDNFYSGTLDALVEIDGILGILDIKTGAGIWDEYSLQLAAYMNAYNKLVPKKRQAKKRWILRLDQFEECIYCGAKKRIKSGRAKVTGGDRNCYHKFSSPKGIFQFKELKGYKEDIKGFLSAQKLWEWSNRRILQQINNYPKKNKLKI